MIHEDAKASAYSPSACVYMHDSAGAYMLSLVSVSIMYGTVSYPFFSYIRASHLQRSVDVFKFQVQYLCSVPNRIQLDTAGKTWPGGTSSSSKDGM